MGTIYAAYHGQCLVALAKTYTGAVLAAFAAGQWDIEIKVIR